MDGVFFIELEEKGKKIFFDGSWTWVKEGCILTTSHMFLSEKKDAYFERLEKVINNMPIQSIKNIDVFLNQESLPIFTLVFDDDSELCIATKPEYQSVTIFSEDRLSLIYDWDKKALSLYQY